MTTVLGLDAKAYRNTGTWGSPVWNLVANIRDATLGLEKGEADVSTRGGNGWEQIVSTLKSANIQFSMVWDTGDEDFEALKDAFINNTLIDMWFVDGDTSTSGNQGLRAEFEVTGFSRNEQLREALTVDVTLKPGRSTVSQPPEWKAVP